MTLVQRPVPPDLVCPPQPTYNGVTIHEEGPTCTCADPDLVKLLDLMNRGVGQVEASRMLWGQPATPDLAPVAPEPEPAPRADVSWSRFLTSWWRG